MLLCWGELERAGWVVWAVGTLLGPERTGVGGAVGSSVVCFFLGPALPVRPPRVVSWVGGGVWVGCSGLLFENCTVDASIFVC